MASDTQTHTTAALNDKHGHTRRQSSLSLRPSQMPTLSTEMSDEDEHNLCHHDHEHEGLKARHQQASAHHGTSEDNGDRNISLPTASKHAEHAVAPFLAKHIPMQYNPLGHMRQNQTIRSEEQLNSSTKFCYRHRPDLKCRRQANEPSMEQLQNVCLIIDCLRPILISVI